MFITDKLKNRNTSAGLTFDDRSISSHIWTQPWVLARGAPGGIPPKGPISAEFTLESTLLHSQSFRFIYRPVCLSHSSSCMLTFCIPVYLISLNKSSINTDWWRNSRGNCAFTGCCDAYSNEFKSIYTGPSFAYVPLDCRQSQLSLPTASCIISTLHFQPSHVFRLYWENLLLLSEMYCLILTMIEGVMFHY